jgi:uncharacterized membrane protein YsdA (DUF1294 family)
MPGPLKRPAKVTPRDERGVKRAARPAGRDVRPQRLMFYTVYSWTIVWLGILLVLPAMSLLKLTEFFDWRLVVGGAVAVSVIAYVVCVMDKRRAQTGQWRIPEATLHTLEFLGGWPGAFLAQRHFRHKTAKTSYRVVFWLIVAAYQVAAFEFLNDGKYSRMLLELAR